MFLSVRPFVCLSVCLIVCQMTVIVNYTGVCTVKNFEWNNCNFFFKQQPRSPHPHPLIRFWSIEGFYCECLLNICNALKVSQSQRNNLSRIYVTFRYQNLIILSSYSNSKYLELPKGWSLAKFLQTKYGHVQHTHRWNGRECKYFVRFLCVCFFLFMFMVNHSEYDYMNHVHIK